MSCMNVWNWCLFSWVPVGLYAIEWSTGRRVLSWPWIIEWKGLEKPWIFKDFLGQEPCQHISYIASLCCILYLRFQTVFYCRLLSFSHCFACRILICFVYAVLNYFHILCNCFRLQISNAMFTTLLDFIFNVFLIVVDIHK